jgi:hypothetical protein
MALEMETGGRVPLLGESEGYEKTALETVISLHMGPDGALFGGFER